MALVAKDTGKTRHRRDYSTAKTAEERQRGGKRQNTKKTELGGAEEKVLQVGQENPGSAGLNREAETARRGRRLPARQAPSIFLTR